MKTVDEKMSQLRARSERAQQEALLKQLQLPFWEDSRRAVPNGLLRSPIFAAIARGKHDYMRRVKLPSVDGIEIVYTGITLSQDYLTLWAQLVHEAREYELGSRCETTTYRLLKSMKKTDSGKNREIIYRMLSELQATAIELTQGRYTYTGSLVDESYRDSETGKIVIILNKKIVSLFQRDQYTKLAWDIRLSLSKKPMAQWLHSFYSTHDNPYAYKIETLHKLCGSDAKCLQRFGRTTLVDGLTALAQQTEAHGGVFRFAIVNGLVHVARSRAQRLPGEE